MKAKTKVETTNLMLWVYSLHCWSDGAFTYFSICIFIYIYIYIYKYLFIFVYVYKINI